MWKTEAGAVLSAAAPPPEHAGDAEEAGSEETAKGVGERLWKASLLDWAEEKECLFQQKSIREDLSEQWSSREDHPLANPVQASTFALLCSKLQLP